MPKPLGVVHVLIAGESPEDRLPQHPDERMSPVLAGAGVGERFARHGGKTERVVEFPLPGGAPRCTVMRGGEGPRGSP